MEQISNWITMITSNMTTIAWGIAVLSIIALAIVLMTGGRSALQNGKGMAAAIFVGMVVLSSAVAIVGTFSGAAA